MTALPRMFALRFWITAAQNKHMVRVCERIAVEADDAPANSRISSTSTEAKLLSSALREPNPD
jgi:hypothetical protein